MPSIKDYDSKKKKARRRPGREEEQQVPHDVKEEEVQEAFGFDETSSFEEPKKVQIEFPYSELIRAKVPKAFDLAESVATEWVQDGSFDNIPVGHPVAQMTVAAGLRKAKEVEKKLEEKGVFMMAKMGIAYAKSKLKK